MSAKSLSPPGHSRSVFLFFYISVVVSFSQYLYVRTASYQLFTCKRVKFVCAAICLFSSSVGYGCWKRKEFIVSNFLLTSYVIVNNNRCYMCTQPILILCLTMRCWKSQERIMLVACFGRTPLLFLDFLSSLSNRDERSTFTFKAKKQDWWKRKTRKGK